MVVHTIYKSN